MKKFYRHPKPINVLYTLSFEIVCNALEMCEIIFYSYHQKHSTECSIHTLLPVTYIVMEVLNP